MQEWCTIESDPGVFTQLIAQLGVKDISVDEIYDLNDDALLGKLEPIYGLIFLFRWTTKAPQREALKVYDPDLFYAKQVIQNACATQAIISVLLNNKHIDVGPELKAYKDFVMDFDPKDRGLSLGNSELIRQTHNSFSRPEPFVFTGSKKAKVGALIDDHLGGRQGVPLRVLHPLQGQGVRARRTRGRTHPPGRHPGRQLDPDRAGGHHEENLHLPGVRNHLHPPRSQQVQGETRKPSRS